MAAEDTGQTSERTYYNAELAAPFLYCHDTAAMSTG